MGRVLRMIVPALLRSRFVECHCPPRDKKQCFPRTTRQEKVVKKIPLVVHRFKKRSTNIRNMIIEVSIVGMIRTRILVKINLTYYNPPQAKTGHVRTASFVRVANTN